MRLILLPIILLFANAALSQQITNLVTVGSAWEIIDNTHVGNRTRVESFNQNPYPFCFSYAASALFDQARCIATGLSDCRKQPRSSALAATPSGQRLPQNQLNTDSGGITRLSLGDLINRGFVPHASCNTEFGQEKDQELNQRMNSGRMTVFNVYQLFKKYRDYTPYLTRYYQHYFIEHAIAINPSLNIKDTHKLLDKSYETKEQLFGAIILGNSCTVPRFSDDRFHIRSAFIGDAEKFDPTKAHNIIRRNLENNRPVSVDFCLMGSADEYGRCVSNARHAAVIIATAKAQHRATGDMRTIYWLINTWGEQWQEKNRDGWVFADKLLHGIYGHLLWLEKK